MNFEDEDFELKEVQRFRGHRGKVCCLAWKPTAGVDGVPAVLASCGVDDKAVRIWEHNPVTRSFKCKAVLEGVHTKPVIACSWSPSGKLLATASHDETTTIWKEAAGGNYLHITTLNEHEDEVTSVAWDLYGTSLATCGPDDKVIIWEVAIPSKVETPISEKSFSVLDEDLTEHVRKVQWHPLVHTLFSCHHGVIKAWDMDPEGDWHNGFGLTKSESGHTDEIRDLSFNATGDKMVSFSNDTVKIWGCDITKEQYKHTGYWKLLCNLSGYHDGDIFSVHWSREGIISSGTGDGAICLFVESKDGLVDKEVEEGVGGPTYRFLHKKEEAHMGVTAVKWSPTVDLEFDEEADEEVEEGVGGPTYRLLLKKKEAHMGVTVVQWSPTENRRLASASSDGTIKIWDLVSSPRKKNLGVS